MNAEGARYLLVDGYAVGFHAEPRFTKDLDLWIEASAANSERVYSALKPLYLDRWYDVRRGLAESR